MRLPSRIALGSLALLVAVGRVPLPAQGDAREATELRRRVVEIRMQLPAITEAAEYAAGFFKDDTTKRLLVSKSLDQGFHLEFYWHGGGPPETGNADDPSARGVVLLPIRHWEGTALGVAMRADQERTQGRPVIAIGPAAERPTMPVGRRFLDNAAPNGDRADADLNSIANIIVGWTWYVETVAAATRDGWWLGTNQSMINPGAQQHNATVHFHMPAPPPAVIPPGSLGAAYLNSVDAILAAAERPAHARLVGAVADTLRAQRERGSRLFVASCAHYLQEEIQRDTLATPFRAVDWRWDVPAKLRARGAGAGDAMLWFGYGGYDCPHITVSADFAAAGLLVTVVTALPNGSTLAGVVSRVPLNWRLPDAGAPVPFPPGAIGATASIDMALHYLWLKRLVGRE